MRNHSALTDFFLQPFKKKFQAESPVTMPAKGAHEVPDMLLQGF